VQPDSPWQRPVVILDIVRQIRGGLDAADQTGNYAQFFDASAELRRLADGESSVARAHDPTDAGAEARQLFMELRRVVQRSVRVDARRRPIQHA
jgi:hypothetical protein